MAGGGPLGTPPVTTSDFKSQKRFLVIEFVKNHKKFSGFVAFISFLVGLDGWEASSGFHRATARSL
jgi:hypothetical protein